MKPSEANKIIAGYMGYRPYLPWNEIRKAYKDDKNRVWESFSESLDSLVPVLEKANLEIHNTTFSDEGIWWVVLNWRSRILSKSILLDWETSKTIQEAAAIATARAIQALWK